MSNRTIHINRLRDNAKDALEWACKDIPLNIQLETIFMYLIHHEGVDSRTLTLLSERLAVYARRKADDEDRSNGWENLT